MSSSPNSKQLTCGQIRQQFLDFFSAQGHAIVPSSPVVPLDDPTLLFTNAGMNQFKDVFLGTGSREYKRAADTQKCIRAGGKHNDLDDVGHDTYHHTFFEMLGSWSFGDYFKQEAIGWAWQLLHEEWGIPKERLHATYFAGDQADGLPADEEARQLWLDTTSIDESRVHAFSKSDNFWEMADTGPCGPCTEIHVDMTPDLSGGPLVNADDPRVFEVWNLVFIQFNREATGALETLPAQHVDTGMGFERLVAVLQNKRSNYDTDVFSPLMEAIRLETGAAPYAGLMATGAPSPEQMRDVTYRILADHLRCLSFAITDGALPDSDGRGYVLRRILRRAYRYGRQYLGVDRPFLHRLVPAVAGSLGDAFPELRAAQDRVAEAIHEEEESFARTLDTGLRLFSTAASKAEEIGKKRIDGATAFKLHDTYGFPIDLTTIIAGERGLEVDVAGYESHMEAAREKARAGQKGDAQGATSAVMAAVAGAGAEFFDRTRTDDSAKFSQLEHGAEVLGWLDPDGTFHLAGQAPAELGAGRDVGLVLSSTCFYAEQGGQVGDRGVIEGPAGRFEVLDTQRAQDTVLHIGHLTDGSMAAGERVTACLADGRRRAIMANHTATHLLNHGLRDVLGEHVQQRGSLVDDEKTRFDFSHRKSLSGEEIGRLEQHVERQIEAQLNVYDAEVPLEEAMAVNSLRAVFGEKYPERVRVVSIGVPVADLLADKSNDGWRRYSIELCGGTHVAEASTCGPFVLLSEEAVSKGVRRLVGITGEPAQRAIDMASIFGQRAASVAKQQGQELQAGVAALLEDVGREALPLRARHELLARIEELQATLREQQRLAAAEKGAAVIDVARELLEQAPAVGDSRAIVGSVPEAPTEKLREAADWLRQKAGSAAVLLFSPTGAKVTLLAALTPDLVDRGLSAKAVLGQAGKIVGGGGGGRPELAQGGGKKPEKVPEAVESMRAWLTEQL